jgi:cell wall-associated NlpC family hydrolase
MYKTVLNTRDFGKALRTEIRQLHKVAIGLEEPGDFIFLTVNGSLLHASVVIGDGTMLHVTPWDVSCIERYDAGFWSDKIYGIYSYE